MVDFNRVSSDDYDVIFKIIDRAVKDLEATDRTSLEMDLAAAHIHMPLDLNKLLEFDKFNFAHDLAGIQATLNRKTGKLEKFFVPRCVKKKKGGN